MSSNLSAIELLNLGEADRKKPALNYYWPQLLGVTFGVCSGCIINFATRRPTFSGIQKHLFGVVFFTGTFTYLNQRRENYLAEKDAVLRHYIELHPEDFPTLGRKKIADIIEPWHPIR